VAEVTYQKDITGLVMIDPYNDFISEGGKLWDRLKGVAEANGCIPHMLDVLNAARRADIRVFYALHHRYRPVDETGQQHRQTRRHCYPMGGPYASGVVGRTTPACELIARIAVDDHHL
jgi:nicotinamidase-related amidase